MAEPSQRELIARRLRRWRAEKDWSGASAAEAITAAGRPTLWTELRKIETAEVEPDERFAVAVAVAYGKSKHDLIGPETVEEEAARVSAERPAAPPDTRPEPVRRRSPYRPSVGSRLADSWDLRPGETIVRKVLHDRYGGGRQGGIAPCRESPNVFVFSDPFIGETHGYFDRWEGEVFLYVGEGQVGDQQIVRGNAAILHHRRDRRALRVFEGVGGTVRYAGEFEVGHSPAYTWELAPSTGGGPMRRVIVFRLLPSE